MQAVKLNGETMKEGTRKQAKENEVNNELNKVADGYKLWCVNGFLS